MGAEDAENLYVWGTNLTISGITKRVRAFYRGFKADDADGMPKYEEMLRQVRHGLALKWFAVPTAVEQSLCQLHGERRCGDTALANSSGHHYHAAIM